MHSISIHSTYYVLNFIYSTGTQNHKKYILLKFYLHEVQTFRSELKQYKEKIFLYKRK